VVTSDTPFSKSESPFLHPSAQCEVGFLLVATDA